MVSPRSPTSASPRCSTPRALDSVARSWALPVTWPPSRPREAQESRPCHRRLWPGGSSLRVPDRSAAVPCPRSLRDPLPGDLRRTDSSSPASARHAAQFEQHLSEVPGEGTGQCYASAAALADDLQRFLAGQPIQARPVGIVGRGWRWCRRNPVVAAPVTAVAALLIVGTAISTHLAITANHHAGVADTRTEEARQKAKLAEEQKKEADKQNALPSRLAMNWKSAWLGIAPTIGAIRTRHSAIWSARPRSWRPCPASASVALPEPGTGEARHGGAIGTGRGTGGAGVVVLNSQRRQVVLKLLRERLTSVGSAPPIRKAAASLGLALAAEDQGFFQEAALQLIAEITDSKNASDAPYYREKLGKDLMGRLAPETAAAVAAHLADHLTRDQHLQVWANLAELLTALAGTGTKSGRRSRPPPGRPLAAVKNPFVWICARQTDWGSGEAPGPASSDPVDHEAWGTLLDHWPEVKDLEELRFLAKRWCRWWIGWNQRRRTLPPSDHRPPGQQSDHFFLGETLWSGWPRVWIRKRRPTLPGASPTA